MTFLRSTFFHVLLLTTCLLHQAWSQEQLSTLTKTNDGSAGGQGTLFKGELYFLGSTAEHGTELWKTDGTTAGTILIKDIAPGPRSAEVNNMTAMGAYLYFWANDGNSGEQIWRTDGTAENTIRITDHPGKRKSELASNGTDLFYFTSTYENTDFSDIAVHFWATDGTPFQERLLEKEFPVSGTESIRFLIAFDSILYLANKNANSQIWQSDGTEAGTFPVTNELGETSPLSDFRHPLSLSFFKGEAYFWARSPELINYPQDYGLFKIDRSTNSIQLIQSFFGGELGLDDVSWQVIDDYIYYLLYDEDGSSQQLVRSDGSPEGTQILRYSQGYGNFDPSNLIAIDKKLYFTSSNFDPDKTTSLFEFDTETEQERELAAFNAQLYLFFDPSFTNIRLSTNQQQIFIDKFPFYNGGNDHNFFIYDLPLSTLDTIDVISYGRSSGQILNGEYIFPARDRANSYGQELYRIDTATKQTQLIKNVNEASINRVDRLFPFHSNDQLLAQVFDSIWYAAALNRVTQQLTYISAPYLNNDLSKNAQLGDKVIFSYNDQEFREELGIWEDGEFKLLADLAGSDWGRVSLLTPHQDRVYFAAAVDSDPYLQMFYSTDGTTTGTQPLLSLPEPIEFEFIEPADNFLYLSTTNAGSNVYRFDPLTNDTIHIDHFYNVRDLLPVGDEVVIQVEQSSDAEKEIFVSDGIQPFTKFPLDNRIEEHSIQFHIAMGDQFFFTAYAPELGYELWAGNSATRTAQLLKDIQSGNRSSTRIMNFAKGEGQLYFTAFDETHGVELWKTDGTTEGTTLVRDINAGPESAAPGEMYFAPNGKLYFTATTADAGTELWVSEGTSATTHRLTDILPGPAHSNPGQYYMVDSILFFTALDEQFAYQLYQLNTNDPVNTKPRLVTQSLVKTYPNPANSHLLIDLPAEINLPVQCNLYDLNGRLIRSSQLSQSRFQIDVSQLIPSTYILNFTNKEMTTSQRVVISR